MTRSVVRSVAVVALLVLAVVVADRSTVVADLTSERSNSLSAQTEAVVARLDGRVRITAVVARDDPGRIDAVTRLDRYERLDRRITTRVLDPADAPGEVARLGLDPLLGGAALEEGGDVTVVASPSEQDLTGGLARLARDEPLVVCATTGHGEREPRGGPAGLDELATTLAGEGATVEALDLGAGAEVPARCSVVLVAGPTAPLGRRAASGLDRWVAGGGRLLLLADPAGDPDVGDLDEVLGPFGLALLPGIVFEGDAASIVGGDVTAPIVRSGGSGHPVARRLAPTYLPATLGIAVDEGAEGDGLTVSRLASSSPASYLETDPQEAAFDPAEDRPGPIVVVAAADRSSTASGRITRSRVVVVGDVDLASNAFIGEGANRELLRRSVLWLADGDEVAAIAANLPADRPLRLTAARTTYARLLAAVGVPLAFLLAGSLVWAVRRRR